jgi:hypothetical protein
VLHNVFASQHSSVVHAPAVLHDVVGGNKRSDNRPFEQSVSTHCLPFSSQHSSLKHFSPFFPFSFFRTHFVNATLGTTNSPAPPHSSFQPTSTQDVKFVAIRTIGAFQFDGDIDIDAMTPPEGASGFTGEPEALLQHSTSVHVLGIGPAHSVVAGLYVNGALQSQFLHVAFSAACDRDGSSAKQRARSQALQHVAVAILSDTHAL